DLVLMKYLAFGLMAALLLDATVVRMFLVPSVMKLLGDDCWWAPRWARRLQNRLGLGEIDLPDEHKRPTVNGRGTRPPVKAAARTGLAPRPSGQGGRPGGAPPPPAAPPARPPPSRPGAPGVAGGRACRRASLRREPRPAQCQAQPADRSKPPPPLGAGPIS